MDGNIIRGECVRLLEIAKRKLRKLVKLKKHDGFDSDNEVKNTLPIQLGALILSNSKRIMNNFIREINVFYNNSIYYGDTDSLYIEKKILGSVR